MKTFQEIADEAMCNAMIRGEKPRNLYLGAREYATFLNFRDEVDDMLCVESMIAGKRYIYHGMWIFKVDADCHAYAG